MGAVYDCTRCKRLIEAVEINYIFVDKNQQTETDNIFFLTLKINSECHCRNMAILDL